MHSGNSSDKPETQEGDAEVCYYESEDSEVEGKKESELMVQDLKDSGEKFDEAIRNL